MNLIKKTYSFKRTIHVALFTVAIFFSAFIYNSYTGMIRSQKILNNFKETAYFWDAMYDIEKQSDIDMSGDYSNQIDLLVAKEGIRDIETKSSINLMNYIDDTCFATNDSICNALIVSRLLRYETPGVAFDQLYALDFQIALDELRYLKDRPNIEIMQPYYPEYNPFITTTYNHDVERIETIIHDYGRPYDYGLYTVWNLFITKGMLFVIVVILFQSSMWIIHELKRKKSSLLMLNTVSTSKVYAMHTFYAFKQSMVILGSSIAVFLIGTSIVGRLGSFDYPVTKYMKGTYPIDNVPIYFQEYVKMFNVDYTFQFITLTSYLLRSIGLTVILFLFSFAVINLLNLCFKNQIKSIMSLCLVVFVSIQPQFFSLLNPFSYFDVNSIITQSYTIVRNYDSIHYTLGIGYLIVVTLGLHGLSYVLFHKLFVRRKHGNAPTHS